MHAVGAGQRIGAAWRQDQVSAACAHGMDDQREFDIVADGDADLAVPDIEHFQRIAAGYAPLFLFKARHLALVLKRHATRRQKISAVVNGVIHLHRQAGREDVHAMALG